MDKSQVRQAGYRISAWCPAVGLSRSTYYALPEELRPPSIRIGKSHIITESPEDYLKRMASVQREEAAA